MRVSFISALHNNVAYSQEMWRSLLATLPAELAGEILLLDNASTDGTRAWLETVRNERARIILADSNLGFAAANNRAAREAHGEILVFLNNDLVLQPGWLAPLIDGFNHCRRAGVIGNVQLVADERTLDHRGVEFDLLRRPFHVQRPSRAPARQDYTKFPAVTAACCAVQRETFLTAGGFDEAFRNGYEDIDLCLRLGQRGFQHYVANRSVVLHHVSMSPGRFTRETENLRLFLQRWGWPPPGPPYRLRAVNYLGRHWRQPWRYNGPKLLLALAWLATGRPCAAVERRLGVTIKIAP